MITPPQAMLLSFVKKEQVSKDAYSFFFDRSKFDFDFYPGQYIRMTLSHPNPDERGESRFFSIASPPYEKNYLMITTRIIQSSFKKALFNLSAGEAVKVFGPQGGFYITGEEDADLVFLAGGIGITPFHSTLLFAAEKNLLLPMTLFVSFSTVEEVLYKDELEKITEKHENLKVVYTITHPQESQKPWSGETGRIGKEMLEKNLSDIKKPKYYIVGPPKMVEAMEEMVKELGVPNEQIRIENFTGY